MHFWIEAMIDGEWRLVEERKRIRSQVAARRHAEFYARWRHVETRAWMRDWSITLTATAIVGAYDGRTLVKGAGPCDSHGAQEVAVN